MADLPVVCTLEARTLITRREGLLARLAASATSREPLPNGLRLTFQASSEALELIAEAIDAERRCCRFLQFAMIVPPDEAPIVVELTGPAGTREFVDALLEPL